MPPYRTERLVLVREPEAAPPPICCAVPEARAGGVCANDDRRMDGRCIGVRAGTQVRVDGLRWPHRLRVSFLQQIAQACRMHFGCRYRVHVTHRCCCAPPPPPSPHLSARASLRSALRPFPSPLSELADGGSDGTPRSPPAATCANAAGNAIAALPLSAVPSASADAPVAHSSNAVPTARAANHSAVPMFRSMCVLHLSNSAHCGLRDRSRFG